MSENLYGKEQKTMTEQGKKNFDQIKWNCKVCGDLVCVCKKITVLDKGISGKQKSKCKCGSKCCSRKGDE